MRKPKTETIDHFAEAERIVATELDGWPPGDPGRSAMIAEAQVHATLALTQATTAARTLGGSVILSGKPDWP